MIIIRIYKSCAGLTILMGSSLDRKSVLIILVPIFTLRICSMSNFLLESLCRYQIRGTMPGINPSRRLTIMKFIVPIIFVSMLTQFTLGAWSITAYASASLSQQSNEISNNSGPSTIILDPSVLLETRQKIMSHNDSTYENYYNKLIEEANMFLSKEPTSVTEKSQLPPSGNKHDFYSLAAYEWPNPNTTDGLPYVSRDGQINPEIYTISDKKYLDDMIQAVKILSFAYYFTNDSRYLEKAQDFLQVWFLNEDTHMNPNLNYAEIVRGKNETNPSGIMEGRPLVELVDSIRIMQESSLWDVELQQGLENWFSQYLDWLLQSDSGKIEGQKMNNHGTYYNVQTSSIALFLNKTELASQIVQASMRSISSASFEDVSKLIALKIKPDGSQPFELRRTNSLDYSMINLLALFDLASIGERVGIDLWNYEIHGAGIRKALDYVLPYALKEQAWPHEQINPIKNRADNLACQGILNYADNQPYVEAYRSAQKANQSLNVYFPICNQIVG
jgi:Alginate lyase